VYAHSILDETFAEIAIQDAEADDDAHGSGSGSGSGHTDDQLEEPGEALEAPHPETDPYDDAHLDHGPDGAPVDPFDTRHHIPLEPELPEGVEEDPEDASHLDHHPESHVTAEDLAEMTGHPNTAADGSGSGADAGDEGGLEVAIHHELIVPADDARPTVIASWYKVSVTVTSATMATFGTAQQADFEAAVAGVVGVGTTADAGHMVMLMEPSSEGVKATCAFVVPADQGEAVKAVLTDEAISAALTGVGFTLGADLVTATIAADIGPATFETLFDKSPPRPEQAAQLAQLARSQTMHARPFTAAAAAQKGAATDGGLTQLSQVGVVGGAVMGALLCVLIVVGLIKKARTAGSAGSLQQESVMMPVSVGMSMSRLAGSSGASASTNLTPGFDAL
jgi:hypothetical protein